MGRRPAGRGGSGRVLHVSQAAETGVPFVVDDYVRAQREAGWTVAVACPGGTLATLMNEADVPVLVKPVDLQDLVRAVEQAAVDGSGGGDAPG